jgi:hypothetical protein
VERIAETKERFDKAIERHASLIITKDGMWRERSKFISILRRIFGFNEAVSTATQFSKYLTTLVTRPCKDDILGFSQPAEWKSLDLEKTISSIKTWLQTTKSRDQKKLLAIRQKRDSLAAHGKLSEAERVAYDRLLDDPTKASGFAAEALLEQSHFMLHYLGISQSEITSTPVSDDTKKSLRSNLLTWQEHHFPFVDYFSDKEQPFTLAKLDRLSQYPEFAKALASNHILRDRCFSWVFGAMPQDCVDAVDIFIQAPPVQKRLNTSFLDRRIQHVKNKGIAFTETLHAAGDRIRKDVKLLIHGMHQSITNKKTLVEISEKVSMAVREVFAKFRSLERGFIGLEYIHDGGIQEFDGRLTNIDFSKPEWWTQIPAIQLVSEDEIADNLKDGHALFAVGASRFTPDDSPEGTHGWVSLYVPYGKDSNGKRLFNRLSIGKFSSTFPITKKEKFSFSFSTHRATLTCVDPNSFNSDRERTEIAFPPLSKEKFENYMEELKGDFQSSLNGTLVFQVQGSENCAGWVRKQVQRLFPDFHADLFEASFTELPLPPSLNPSMKPRKLYSSQRVWLFIRFIIACICPTRKFPNDKGGMTSYRLSNDHLFRSGRLHHPPKLFDRLRRKSIFEAIGELSKTPKVERIPIKIV